MRVLVHLIPFCIAAGSLCAQQPVQSGPGNQGPGAPCIEQLALNVVTVQIPAISIPGISPTDLMAISAPGIPVDVSASGSQLLKQRPECGTVTPEVLTKFAWKLDVPSGSRSTISFTPGPLGPVGKFTPDIAGAYTVHFIACPNKCKEPVVIGATPTGKPIMGTDSIGPQDQTLSIQVKNGVQLPPLLQPADHPIAAGLQATTPQPYTSATNFCTGEAGLILGGDPEWYTTATWTGPTPPYVLAEGRIYKSIIAGADVPLDHHTNDYNGYFDFDPPFQNLLILSNNNSSSGLAEDQGPLLPLGGMEMEWEWPQLPEEFRPVAGDRASALGFHVIDCQHGVHTEIHPPIAVAAHRRSAVTLPATVAFDQANGTPFPVGQNVIVPGITTDIWINLNGGETLDGISRGLHQPRNVETIVGNVPEFLPVAVTQPTTQGVTFTFRVYLPPNPAYVLEQYSLTPYFKPALFWREVPHPAAQKYQPLKTLKLQLVDQRLDGPAPYLLFAIDLSPLATGDKSATRIETAWVYPDISGKNWGLHRISLRLNSLKVNDTGDFTSGDWKLWANMSGASIPWIKLMDCNGCVEQTTYTGQSSGIWSPGAMAPDGTLPGSIARFDTQLADQLEFTGYDQDWFDSDGIATVVLPITNFTPGGTGTTNGSSGDPGFTVQYSSINHADTGAISNQAFAYFGSLVIHPAMTGLIHPEAQAPLFSVTSANAERQKITTQQEDEADNPTMKMLRAMEHGQAPAKNINMETLGQQLRARILDLYGGIPKGAARARVVWRLQQIKPSLPPDIYQKYLCDLETGATCPLAQ